MIQIIQNNIRQMLKPIFIYCMILILVHLFDPVFGVLLTGWISFRIVASFTDLEVRQKCSRVISLFPGGRHRYLDCVLLTIDLIVYSFMVLSVVLWVLISTTSAQIEENRVMINTLAIVVLFNTTYSTIRVKTTIGKDISEIERKVSFMRALITIAFILLIKYQTTSHIISKYIEYIIHYDLSIPIMIACIVAVKTLAFVFLRHYFTKAIYRV